MRRGKRSACVKRACKVKLAGRSELDQSWNETLLCGPPIRFLFNQPKVLAVERKILQVSNILRSFQMNVL